MYPLTTKQARFLGALIAAHPDTARDAIARHGRTGRAISAILAVHPASHFRPGTKQRLLADTLIRAGYATGIYLSPAIRERIVKRAIDLLAMEAQIGRGVLCFKQNTGNGREVTLPMGWSGDDTQQATQYGRARKYLFDVLRKMEGTRAPSPPPEQRDDRDDREQRDGDDDGGRDQRDGRDDDDRTPEPEAETPEQRDETPEPEPEAPEAPPEPKAPAPKWMGWEAFIRKCQSLRAECARRAEIGEPVDEISMRPAIAGSALYKAGAEWAGEFVLDSMTKMWDDAVRDEMGIAPFDTSIVPVPEEYAGKIPPTAHGQIRILLWIVKATKIVPDAAINAYICGPKGTGKTYIAKQLAEILGVEWGFSPLTAGASYTWLTGTYTIEGYVTRPCVDLYENGGVFLMDECDGGDPNMVMVANAMLAGDSFQNPVTGKMLRKHPDFFCLAAGNTWGNGADEKYVGRQKLDAAFLDRFVAGRIEVGYDNALERALCASIMAD